MQRAISIQNKFKLGHAPLAAAAAPAAAAAAASHPTNPFPNQRDAANKIIDEFCSGKMYCLLRADVQSGKTGTYQYLIRLMLEMGFIDRAYILCGSHEIELITQCKADIAEWHPRHRHLVQVLFRQHFERNMMDIRRTLIVVDETHLVCGKDQTLSTFLQRHELTLSGTTPRMVEQSTYILSVDATPFAEESAIIHGNSLPKGRVVLENSEGYFGPHDYFRNGLIHETFDIGAQKANFIELIKRFPRKYLLVRVAKRNKQYKSLMEACRGICNVVYFTSERPSTRVVQIELQQLETAPARTTIVILDGRLRCGKRVPKKHVAVVWETSAAANTDTIIQGLLGRMSGYEGDDVYQLPIDDRQKPLIFLPKRCLKQDDRDMIRNEDEDSDLYDRPLCDLERAYHPDVLPRFASHITPSPVQRRAELEDGDRYPCVPIQFQLSAEDIALLPTASFNDISQMCLDALDIPASYNEFISDEQYAEIGAGIQAKLSGADGRASIRRLQRIDGVDSQLSYFNACIEAIRTHTTVREHITDFPFLSFNVIFPGYRGTDSGGLVFAMFYTRAKGKFDKIHMLSRIPVQDGKTHFTLTPAMRESPAGMVVGLRPSIMENPAHFEEDLDLCIRTSLSSAGVHMRRIEAMFSHKSIVLFASIYGDKFEIFKSILRRLERKYSVTITCTNRQKFRKVGEAIGAGNARIISDISW